jgi:23S rRNA U2552 (ribose-2'-O)-methylase RlmE/FtsJ
MSDCGSSDDRSEVLPAHAKSIVVDHNKPKSVTEVCCGQSQTTVTNAFLQRKRMLFTEVQKQQLPTSRSTSDQETHAHEVLESLTRAKPALCGRWTECYFS